MRTGTFRWCGTVEAEDLKDGTALLEISTSQGVKVCYWVFHGKTTTRIKRMDTGKVYSPNVRTCYCDCSDHRERRIECKHVKALRAALPRVTN